MKKILFQEAHNGPTSETQEGDEVRSQVLPSSCVLILLIYKVGFKISAFKMTDLQLVIFVQLKKKSLHKSTIFSLGHSQILVDNMTIRFYPNF